MGSQALVLMPKNTPRNNDFRQNNTWKDGENIRTFETRRPYKNNFSVVEHDISVPRFNGEHSERMTRAAFISGDAVSVLPYDPVRDRVMLIEQFRFGPHVRGDNRPWKLEAIAGRIDAGESPEETAKREAVEETGLTLRKLIPAFKGYPAPGAVDEYMYSFIGLADLPDGITGVSGLESEDEDIQSHLFDFAEAMALLEKGLIDTGPLISSLLWLALHRDTIRNDA